jgi:hypothetical protein
MSHYENSCNYGPVLINRLFGTRPIAVQAHGPLRHQPAWPPIRQAFVEHPAPCFDPAPRITLLTCNNGHPAMGLFERSVEARGLSCMVRGSGIFPWVNSTDKPRSILQGLLDMNTEYVLFADSRDAILIGDPQVAVDYLDQHRECDLLFGGDRINWPALDRFKQFEATLPGAEESEFRYLNGGIWAGRTEFCREFFAEAVRTAPAPEAPDSEQGILKELFPRFYPRMRLDYRCELIQNIGFVHDPGIFEILETPPCALESQEVRSEHAWK